MEIKEYQEKSFFAIQKHDDQKDEVLNWMVGLFEEVGEIANIVKHTYYGDEAIQLEEIAKEVGDALWYLSAICTTLGLDLDTCATMNIGKLHHRFAQGKFDNEQSKDRHNNEVAFCETEEYKRLANRLMFLTAEAVMRKE